MLLVHMKVMLSLQHGQYEMPLRILHTQHKLLDLRIVARHIAKKK